MLERVSATNQKAVEVMASSSSSGIVMETEKAQAQLTAPGTVTIEKVQAIMEVVMELATKQFEIDDGVGPKIESGLIRAQIQDSLMARREKTSAS